MKLRDAVMLAVIAVALVVTWIADPVPQDSGYHVFADQRVMLSIPRALDVLTNIPLMLVGVLGLVRVMRLARFTGRNPLLYPYGVFFLGLVSTGAGSAYYHLAPDNWHLMWDRLPMTLAFMGLFSAVVAEVVSRRLGLALLLPLLILGVVSVVYWQLTEQAGQGDLRLYGLVQFLPMLLIPLMLTLYRLPENYLAYMLAMMGCYAVAKVFELNDFNIYAMGGMISGHALKHLAAAGGALCVFLMLGARKDAYRTVV